MSTSKKLEELPARTAHETERLLQDHARRFEIEPQEMREQYYDLIKSLGLFAEIMVHPSTMPLFTQRGILLNGVSCRLTAQRNSDTMEIDVLGTGPKAVVAIDAKSRLATEYVKDFLERLPDFFEYYPYYRGLKLFGAVAGLRVDANAVRYAYKKGLFVLAPSGYELQILNDANFVPRTFGAPEKKRAPRKK